jgi:hypothetical protein
MVMELVIVGYGMKVVCRYLVGSYRANNLPEAKVQSVRIDFPRKLLAANNFSIIQHTP